MKKTKILTSLTSLGALTAVAPIVVTSCSNSEEKIYVFAQSTETKLKTNTKQEVHIEFSLSKMQDSAAECDSYMLASYELKYDQDIFNLSDVNESYSSNNVAINLIVSGNKQVKNNDQTTVEMVMKTMDGKTLSGKMVLTFLDHDYRLMGNTYRVIANGKFDKTNNFKTSGGFSYDQLEVRDFQEEIYCNDFSASIDSLADGKVKIKYNKTEGFITEVFVAKDCPTGLYEFPITAKFTDVDGKEQTITDNAIKVTVINQPLALIEDKTAIQKNDTKYINLDLNDNLISHFYSDQQFALGDNIPADLDGVVSISYGRSLVFTNPTKAGTYDIPIKLNLWYEYAYPQTETPDLVVDLSIKVQIFEQLTLSLEAADKTTTVDEGAKTVTIANGTTGGAVTIKPLLDGKAVTDDTLKNYWYDVGASSSGTEQKKIFVENNDGTLTIKSLSAISSEDNGYMVIQVYDVYGRYWGEFEYWLVVSKV